MEPVKLSGHHIGNLRDHHFSRRLTEAMGDVYGQRFANNAAGLFDEILAG